MTGEMFGPYVLDGLIGRGGMGEVFRARDSSKNYRTVAVKRLSAEFAVDPAFQERFRRESQIVADLEDVHIIPIYNYGEIDGQLFLEMPLITGVDLASLIERSPSGLAPERVVRIVSQVAGALDAAHRDGLVHRDVKPSNILIRDSHGSDFAYLIDFGIARAIDDEKVTVTGAVVGTLAYMAPERFDGVVDPRADIYALACVLFEALAGHAPFVRHDLATYLRAHLDAPPPLLSLKRSDIPKSLDPVIARGMAKDPAARHQRAGELAMAARIALRTPRAGTAHTGHPALTSATGGTPNSGSRLVIREDVPTALSPAPLQLPPKPTGSLADRLPSVARLRQLFREKRYSFAAALSATTVIAVAVFVLPNALNMVDVPSVVDSVSSIQLASGADPLDVAISPDGAQAYILSDEGGGTVSVVDLDADPGVVESISVGSSPRAISVSPDGNQLYVANSAESSAGVSVVELGRPQATRRTVSSQSVIGGIAAAPAGGMIYVAAINLVRGINLATPGSAATEFALDANPRRIAIAPDGQRIFVTILVLNSIAVVDLNRPGSSPMMIATPGRPYGVAVSPDGSRLYATIPELNVISEINVDEPAIVGTSIPFDGGPQDIAIAPDGSRLYVTRLGIDVLSVVDL